MTLTHFVSRPVPRAGALLLFLAGAAALTLGGYLAATAALGPEERLVFLRDARIERAAAAIDDEAGRAAEIETIRRRGGPSWYVSLSITQTDEFFKNLRDARDEQFRENARRWRRTQALMGGWFGLAALGLVATGVRQWRRSRVSGSVPPA